MAKRTTTRKKSEAKPASSKARAKKPASARATPARPKKTKKDEKKASSGGRARASEGRAKPRRSATSAKGGARQTPKRLTRRPDALPQQARSKTEAAMRARLETLEPGTPRYEALNCAIEFKRSWLDLAGQLSLIATNGAFQEWGYRTPEAYGQQELHLRKETALKLMRSYDFLKSHEADLLEEQQSSTSPPPLPSYQALDVLAEARKNPYLSEDDYRDLREQVFREDASAAKVKRALNERAPDPEKVRDPRAERLGKALTLSERAYGILLEQPDVPEQITSSLEMVIGRLRRLIEG